MKTNKMMVFCMLLAVAVLYGVEQKNKLPVQRPGPSAVATTQLYQLPHITQAQASCSTAPSGQFEVFGKNLGPNPGTWMLCINGVPQTAYLSWQNNSIRCAYTYELPGGVAAYIKIIDAAKNKLLSNVFDYVVPFCIYSPQGTLAAKCKSKVTLFVKPQVGAHALGRKVMIGSKEADAQWGGNKIIATVPYMPLGSYSLRIEKNGQIISNELAVTVQ